MAATISSSEDLLTAVEEEKQENSYTIRPNIKKKFRPAVVKALIHNVLSERFHSIEYDAEETAGWTKEISDEIKDKLKVVPFFKELDLPRYKFIVQVVIGEQRGEGVRMGCRCFWDADTDNYAQDIFMNSSLFCVAAAFGVFYY